MQVEPGVSWDWGADCSHDTPTLTPDGFPFKMRPKTSKTDEKW